MSLARLFLWIIILIVGFYVLKFMGMTPADLWRSATGKITNFKEETVNLTSGKAVQQVSDRMRSEIKPQATPAAPSNIDQELQKELHAERVRIMEAKLDALQKVKITPVEPGKLGEQVVKNAQAAGGGN